ncbi:MAG: DUF11 domain-containing protein [Psychrobacter sp.]|nr:DUF11 domain-containing protein [Psychrobacter sp.]
MKSNLFKHSVLTVGIVSAMGITGTAIAATTSVGSSPSITNVATATYSIGDVAQTAVKSNPVTVNITQSAAFDLSADNEDGDTADDYNKSVVVTPKGRVSFSHTLTNSGNIDDSYTMSLTQGGAIPGITPQNASDYDLDLTNVTYIIYSAAGAQTSSTTVTGTEFQNKVIVLPAGGRADIAISAKTRDNVGGELQNLTLGASSTFITTAEPAKANLTNVNNSTTKVPVFKITSRVNSTLDLNDASDIVTYTVTVLNDGSAAYFSDATGISIIDNLPAGLRLASSPNLSVSNGASIAAGKNGAGSGSNNDSVLVTNLNLAVGETATITFDVQRDVDEFSAVVKGVVNHATVKLNLGADSGEIYDTTDPDDTAQNTGTYYPAIDDSELINGATNNATGGDSTSPLIANQRAFDISGATSKEIPTNTSATTLVTHSAVITNSGKEIEGDTPGEIKFTITPDANNKVTVVTGSVELVYDPDNNPATPNFTYTILRDTNGDNDLTNALPKDGAPAWTGMAPGSTVTINYKTKSENAVLGTTENINITLVPGGTDAPAVPNTQVINKTVVKGLILNKQQALNATCGANAALNFGDGPLSAQPGNCIVYKISAFNNFSTADARFTFDNTLISDVISQFGDVATVLTGTTTPSFEIKLDDVTGDTIKPVTNKYSADLDATRVGGTVTTIAPQKYAAMMFAVRINPEGTEVTPPSQP